jgi:plasmid maintenance system antidote protein VapI
MPRVVSPARQIMIDRGIDPDEMASLVGCGRDKLSRYMTGERKITAGARHRVIARFGPSIQILINAIDQARVDMEDRNPWDRELGRRRRRMDDVRAEAKDPPLVSTHVFDKDPGGCTYTIAEWRERFGAPGSHADVHGRQFGAYATED